MFLHGKTTFYKIFTKFGSDFASRILKSKGIFKFTIGKQLIQNKLSEK